MAVKQKNPAAVTLGRRGGKKGRWAKAKAGSDFVAVKGTAIKTSDDAVLSLLKRIKTTDDPAEVKRLSDQLERVIFHKQFETA